MIYACVEYIEKNLAIDKPGFDFYSEYIAKFAAIYF